MPSEFTVQRVVEFSETDMAGIVHFTNFFRYMEQAEHAFYRSLGISVMMEQDGRMISWPRISASCDYKRPLRFEDTFEIQLQVKEKKNKSIVYQFTFIKTATKDGQLAEPEFVAKGELVIVCVEKDGKGGMTSIEIPDVISNLIDQAPADQLK